MELEQSQSAFKPDKDPRPRMPEPLPVKLIAVEDVHAPATVGLERQLDDFYVKLLEFERLVDADGLVYRADNFKLHFDLIEGLVARDEYRPIVIEIQSRRDTEKKLIDAELEYTRQKGLTPGSERLVLLDPAGNWVELVEARRVM